MRIRVRTVRSCMERIMQSLYATIKRHLSVMAKEIVITDVVHIV